MPNANRSASHILHSVSTSIGKSYAFEPRNCPRAWQIDALERWTKNRRGIVQVVTGGGKTIFSYLCLEKFFLLYPHGKAIIVVPTLVLLDQWCVDILEATNLQQEDIKCFSGKEHATESGRVNIIVLNSARVMPAILASLSPTILVVDECHRAGSGENCKALFGKHQATLGLSATPERDNDCGLEMRIIPALGPIIYRYGYRNAKDDGIIADFKLVNVEVGKPSNDARFVALEEVEKAIVTALRIPWAVKLAMEHKNEGVIIFHERVDSVRRIGDLLSQMEQNVVSYHSDMSESHRRDNLRLFRRGIVDMLVTCRALDEGANVPEASVAVIARSTRSTRQRIQRLGRVLRPAPGKSHAVVYTLFVGDEERDRLAREAVGMEGVADVAWKRGSVR